MPVINQLNLLELVHNRKRHHDHFWCGTHQQCSNADTQRPAKAYAKCKNRADRHKPQDRPGFQGLQLMLGSIVGIVEIHGRDATRQQTEEGSHSPL